MSAPPAASAEGQAPPKKNLGKFLPLLFAVINLGVCGFGSFLIYKSTLGYEYPKMREPAAVDALQKQRKDVDTQGAILYTLPTFTLNLAGTPRRLISVEMSLEMLDKEGFEEIVRNSPAARDQIMRILNRKTFDDLETIQGKLFLKDQIAVALNQSMKKAVVKDIYFSQFIIQ